MADAADSAAWFEERAQAARSFGHHYDAEHYERAASALRAQPSHQQQPVEEVFGWVWRVIGQIRWYFCMGAERPNLSGFGQCDCIPVYRRRVTEETKP